MRNIPRVLAALLGVVLAGPFAMRWIFSPQAMADEQHIALGGPDAFSHMRGDTGGAFLAVGLLALLGVLRKEPGWLEAVALIMVCIVAGRLYGIAADGFDPKVGVAMGVEVLIAAATYATARQLRAEAR